MKAAHCSYCNRIVGAKRPFYRPDWLGLIFVTPLWVHAYITRKMVCSICDLELVKQPPRQLEITCSWILFIILLLAIFSIMLMAAVR